MNGRHPLDVYRDQHIRVDRYSRFRFRELERFVSFSSDNYNGRIDYSVVSDWITHRGKNLSANSLPSIQNSISSFAEFARLLDPSIGFVPRARLKHRNRRKPVILNRDQICKFIDCQSTINSKYGINQITYPVITAFLYVTGLRISEALNMQTEDVDLDDGFVYVPSGKGEHDRVVPISQSTCERLYEYSVWREQTGSIKNLFFMDEYKHSQRYNNYRKNYIQVAELLGYRECNLKGRNPLDLQIHDLRHTYAVNSLIKLYESNEDVTEGVHKLSGLMGHSDIDHTYWYIESVPRLVDAAFERCMS